MLCPSDYKEKCPIKLRLEINGSQNNVSPQETMIIIM